MDRLRNELEQAQREKNEARQNKIETRIRLAKKPTLKYQPSKTFNETCNRYGYVRSRNRIRCK